MILLYIAVTHQEKRNSFSAVAAHGDNLTIPNTGQECSSKFLQRLKYWRNYRFHLQMIWNNCQVQ